MCQAGFSCITLFNLTTCYKVYFIIPIFTDEKTDAHKSKLLAQGLEGWKWGLGFESNLDLSNSKAFLSNFKAF